MSNILFLKPAPSRLPPSVLTTGRALPPGSPADSAALPDFSLLTTLDALGLAAIVVDARLRVCWANGPARRDLGRAFGSLDPKMPLKPGRAEAIDRMLRAVRSACAGQPEDVVLQHPSSEVPLLVRVLPVCGSGEDPLALLLVVEPTASDKRDASVVESRLSALFGLTPMEARVACRLANGDGMNKVAGALGIAVSTARTHAARCYEKTGVRRQAALARLANRLRQV